MVSGFLTRSCRTCPRLSTRLGVSSCSGSTAGPTQKFGPTLDPLGSRQQKAPDQRRGLFLVLRGARGAYVVVREGRLAPSIQGNSPAVSGPSRSAVGPRSPIAPRFLLVGAGDHGSDRHCHSGHKTSQGSRLVLSRRSRQGCREEEDSGRTVSGTHRVASAGEEHGRLSSHRRSRRRAARLPFWSASRWRSRSADVPTSHRHPTRATPVC